MGISAKDITNEEINDIIFYAFRYCLGRRTYAVKTFVDIAVKYWPEIQLRNRHLMRDEINKALADDAAGMDMDRKQWQRLLMDRPE